jgi:exopolysaccharide biosynthesis protein
MRSLIKFFTGKYVYAICSGILICGFFTYTLLDAFVIKKVYIIDSAPDAGHSDNTVYSEAKEQVTAEKNQPKAIITDNSYIDNNISISIETVIEDDVSYYVADIKLSDVKYLKAAFAQGMYGKNITEKTSDIAKNNNAIFAINGDYYGFRDDGLIIRNARLYRENLKKAPYDETLAIYDDGRMEIISESQTDVDALLRDDIYHTFSFGPVLVLDGKAVDRATLKKKSSVPISKNPRTAIGQIEPLHYIAVVVDGRSKTSSGMTLSELAEVFVERGCSIAYNLDGGGSSTMYFNGNVINNPTDGRKAGERKISDIIYLEGTGNWYE